MGGATVLRQIDVVLVVTGQGLSENILVIGSTRFEMLDVILGCTVGYIEISRLCNHCTLSRARV
jgi:hypothetical protein